MISFLVCLQRLLLDHIRVRKERDLQNQLLKTTQFQHSTTSRGKQPSHSRTSQYSFLPISKSDPDANDQKFVLLCFGSTRSGEKALVVGKEKRMEKIIVNFAQFCNVIGLIVSL